MADADKTGDEDGKAITDKTGDEDSKADAGNAVDEDSKADAEREDGEDNKADTEREDGEDNKTEVETSDDAGEPAAEAATSEVTEDAAEEVKAELEGVAEADKVALGAEEAGDGETKPETSTPAASGQVSSGKSNEAEHTSESNETSDTAAKDAKIDASGEDGGAATADKAKKKVKVERCYDIAYDDGDSETAVRSSLIRPITQLKHNRRQQRFPLTDDHLREARRYGASLFLRPELLEHVALTGAAKRPARPAPKR